MERSEANPIPSIMTSTATQRRLHKKQSQVCIGQIQQEGARDQFF